MKYLIKLLGIALLFFGFQKNTEAQCEISISAYPPVEVYAGGAVFLTSIGSCSLMSSNFNNNLIGTGWSSTSTNPVFTNPCGPGPNGSYLWVGTTASTERTLATNGFDVSNGGCVIKWDMRYGKGGPNSAPCENPDLPAEGVHMQYSTNGTTWTDFLGPNTNPLGPNSTTGPFVTTTPGTGGYWLPVSNDINQTSTVYFWHSYESPVPTAATTTNTQFRWAQLSTSSIGFDAWGIDEVKISCSNSSTNVLWSNGSTVFTPGHIVLPPHPQLLAYDTCFIVHIWDSINPAGAYDTVCIHVLPIPISNLGPDTTICIFDTLLLNTQLSSNYYFIWTANGHTLTTHLPYISTDSAGIYTVEMTYSGGTIYDTIMVNVTPNPIVNLGSDTSIYWTNGSVVLNAGNQGSLYYWNSILGPQTKIFNNTNLTNNDTNVVYVDIIDGFGCFASDTVLIIVINDVSIDLHESDEEILIYPNPSRGKVYVNILGMKKDCWVNLSTIDGRSIHRSKYYSGSQVMVFDIENLAKGVYLLNISNEDLNKTIKVIIN